MTDGENKGDRGEQGEPGQQGKPGEPGLNRATRQALVYLFVLNLLIGAGAVVWVAQTARYNTQQRCASLESDSHIPVTHPIAGNPSREWEAAFEAIARHRAQQLGCTR